MPTIPVRSIPRHAKDGFGDLTYLGPVEYEARVRALVTSAVRLSTVPDGSIKEGADGDSELWVYSVEEYHDLAKNLGLWPEFARATYKGVIITRIGQTPLILADRRTCPFLGAEDRVTADAAATLIGAEAGESCDGACARQGKACSPEQLFYVNTCEALARVFPCEAGCGHETGKEIPCYVADDSQVTRRQCLTTTDPALECSASHHSTRRLCPCT